MYSLAGQALYVAGHRGMVGSVIVRRLAAEGCEIMTASRDERDLKGQRAVRDWMAEKRRPQAVFLAATKVCSVLANDSYPTDFFYDDLIIQANLIEAAHRSDVEKMLFMGSSCFYPKLAPQPIPEEALLTGPLEPTKEWYVIAKIAGIKLCQTYRRQHGRDFILAMPTNLYGPGDNFNLNSSHVVPARIRKSHEAKSSGAPLVVWGTGSPRREFLLVDDCSDACGFLIQNYSDAEQVNVGSGTDLSVLELTMLVAEIIGYDGTIEQDLSKPGGAPRKLMDEKRLAKRGWSASSKLETGLAGSYAWFLEQAA